MDPIAHIVTLAGEDAVIQSPATVATYGPAASGDYTPNAPASLNVRGVPETKIELVDGASGAFTCTATSVPDGLLADASKLVWRGTTWTIVKWRWRTWLGKTNGLTLFLAA